MGPGITTTSAAAVGATTAALASQRSGNDSPRPGGTLRRRRVAPAAPWSPTVATRRSTFQASASRMSGSAKSLTSRRAQQLSGEGGRARIGRPRDHPAARSPRSGMGRGRPAPADRRHGPALGLVELVGLCRGACRSPSGCARRSPRSDRRNDRILRGRPHGPGWCRGGEWGTPLRRRNRSSRTCYLSRSSCTTLQVHSRQTGLSGSRPCAEGRLSVPLDTTRWPS